MKLKVTDIKFYFTTEDVGENINFEILKDHLENNYIGMVFEVENENEIENLIYEKSGWKVKFISYTRICN